MARPLRALLIEDDPSWQQIIRETLSERGSGVDLATNRNEGNCQGHRSMTKMVYLQP